jgi:hypothetical protein
MATKSQIRRYNDVIGCDQAVIRPVELNRSAEFLCVDFLRERSASELVSRFHAEGSALATSACCAGNA